jgi:hypothetical protein
MPAGMPGGEESSSRGCRDMKTRRTGADEDGEHVFELVTLRLKRRNLGLGACHFGFGLRLLQFTARTGLHTCTGDFERLISPADGFTHDAHLVVERAQLEVIHRHLGLNAQQHIVNRIRRRSGICACSFSLAADLAPQIELPTEVERRIVGRTIIVRSHSAETARACFPRCAASRRSAAG